MLFWLTLPFLFSQILAVLAMISDLIAFQMKKREYILYFGIFTVACLSLHHFLLWNTAASVILWLAVIRYIVSVYIQDKRVLVIFLIIALVAFMFTYEKIEDFLVLFGTIFFTISVFQKDEKKLRMFTMFGLCFYILFNVLVFSPFAILARLTVFSSNAIGYYRHHIKN